jgi:hypothetical protein
MATPRVAIRAGGVRATRLARQGTGGCFPDTVGVDRGRLANSAKTYREQELSSGLSLVGLRERVHAAGGYLHAGPYHGGYRLAATLVFASTAQQIRLHHPQVASAAGQGCGGSMGAVAD